MMGINERFTGWATAWALVDGKIVCAVCKRSQAVTEAGDDFRHAKGCTAERFSDRKPWVELQDVLEHEHG